MRLSDLCPFPTFVTWEGEPVQLKPFCLRAITWAERFFFKDGVDGFERMNLILSNQEGQEVLFNTLVDIAYYLGVDDFGKIGVKSPVVLKLKIAESKEKLKILGNFKTGIEQVILNSFPDPKPQRPEFRGGKGFDELNRKNAKESQKQDNWEQIYIEFFRSGGMSIDQFMDLTMRQITPLVQELQHKRHEELNVLSDLIHKKIKIKKPFRKPPETEFTKEDVQTFEKMHAKLVEQSRIN